MFTSIQDSPDHITFDEDTPRAATLIILADHRAQMRSQRMSALHEVAGISIINRVITSFEMFEPRAIFVICLEETQRSALTAALTTALTQSPMTAPTETQSVQKSALDLPSVISLGELAEQGSNHPLYARIDGCADLDHKRQDQLKDTWITFGDLPNLSSEALSHLARTQPKTATLSVYAPELTLIRTRSSQVSKCLLSCLSKDHSHPTYHGARGAASALLEDLASSLKSARIEFSGDGVLDFERVSDRLALARAEAHAQAGLAERVMRGGATLIRPETVRLDARVQLGEDVLIEEDVTLLGDTKVGAGAIIERGCRVVNSVISADAHVRAYSHLEGAWVGEEVSVGPFARLREGARLEHGAKVGNFVEIKKTTLEAGAKASHLSYLGDAHIGRGANIGAGTITCNYDGYQKHKTEVGEGAFIGSDTQLVAPVRVGPGAIVAAGTTVTRDVEPDALVLTRPETTTREGWAARFRARQQPKE